MRLLFGPDGNGKLQATDADTGAVLPFEAVQVVQDLDTGKAWLWLGTTHFGAVTAITPAPTPTAPAKA